MNKLTNGKIAMGAPHSLARQAQADAFTKYNDPAHGWLEVPIQVMRQVGIDPSRYPHQNGMVYLEEDCEQTKFEKRYEELNGCHPIAINKWTNEPSFVRELPILTEGRN